jgi:hypothetical protein
MSTPNWDRLWRSAGIQFVLCFVIGYFVYQDGNRMRILIAAFIFGMAVLNLLWFAAAIRSVLRDAGQGGWGAAATASSAALGALFFGLIAVGAALAGKVAGSGLSDVAWAGIVVTSFPRAMLIMAGSFGLWRAGKISNAVFGACVAAVVLVLLGGTTLATRGVWAPDGAYSRFISPIIGIAWIVGISGVLLKKPSAAPAPNLAPAPQW